MGIDVIKLYNQRAKEIWFNVDLKERRTNIRYRGYYTIEYNNKVISRLINKIVRLIDVVDEERRYINKKFK